MKARNRVRISQCMIVKNEEKNIERALSWGKGIVSEQIVVDTGSTDRTVELAEKMGATVYHFDWIDDFSAAKNYAISKAKHEWIAFLDADEYFTPEDGRKLQGFIQKLHESKYNCIMTGWIHLDNQGDVLAVGSQTRIFRNTPGLRYQGRIHEKVASVDNFPCVLVDAVEELSIYHTGYGAIENQTKTESKRNLNLILAELEDNPNNYDMLGYLGDEYYSAYELDKAEEAFRKSISLMPKESVNYDIRTTLTFEKLLSILSDKPDTEEKAFMDIYNQAIKKVPKEADFDYFAGRYFASRGDFKKGEEHLKRALKILEEHGYTSKSMFLSANIKEAYELLAACSYNNENVEGCINSAVVLLKMDKYLMSTLFLLLMSFRQDESNGKEGTAASLVEFLGKNLYDFHILKDRLFVLKAAMKAEYQSLIQAIRGMFTPEELKIVDMALAKEEQ
ncbi:glycosyltransferase [Lachnospiraceae bacterium 62-35]